MTVVLTVTRALWHHGEPVPAGATLKVPALEAQQLLDSGRARLVHAADQRQCHDAVRDDIAAQLKRSGAGRIAAPPEGWPWVRNL